MSDANPHVPLGVLRSDEVTLAEIMQATASDLRRQLDEERRTHALLLVKYNLLVIADAKKNDALLIFTRRLRDNHLSDEI